MNNLFSEILVKLCVGRKKIKKSDVSRDRTALECRMSIDS